MDQIERVEISNKIGIHFSSNNPIHPRLGSEKPVGMLFFNLAYERNGRNGIMNFFSAARKQAFKLTFPGQPLETQKCQPMKA